MTIELHFGLQAVLRWEAPRQSQCTVCDAPRGEPLADVTAAAMAALREPLGYPPLAQAVVPGDRVTIAVADGLPRASQLVDAVARTLVESGVEAADITVLLAADAGRSAAARDSAERTLASLATDWPDARRLVHDPTDRRQLAFLARTDDQMQVLLNRTLTDADVAVSIGCLQPSGAIGYAGPAGTLCPTFSDEAIQKRFRSFHATESPRQHAERAREKAAEVAWLLGARFTLQVVPGRGDDVLAVLAGDLDAVAAAGLPRCDAAWSCADLSPASLVVAAIDTGSRAATWDDFGRAVAAAADVAEPGGAIAICSELAAPPGEALQMLAGADQVAEAVAAIRKATPWDAMPALQLARALADHPVYLLSRLPARDVEELGMVAVSHPGEIEHLASTRPSCLILPGGQHIQVQARAQDHSPRKADFSAR